MRYKVTMAYNGLNYVGFQRQKNGLAIQEVVEERLKTIFNHEVKTYMASRTDSGVHAFNQVFHFDEDKVIEDYKLKGALNGMLPKDIHILNVEKVGEDFHSRYSVKSKTYLYIINIGEYDVFLNGQAYQCPFKLDTELIKEGMKLFVGRHDFTSFNTSPLDLYPDQVREIYDFKMARKGDVLYLEITGNGFLRHMVRMIVGTLVDLGRGKKSLKDVEEMIKVPNKGTRRYNIDPNGLYLKMIYY